MYEKKVEAFFTGRSLSGLIDKNLTAFSKLAEGLKGLNK